MGYDSKAHTSWNAAEDHAATQVKTDPRVSSGLRGGV